MKSCKIVVAIERETEGEGYSAFSPTLPGRSRSGKAVQEARQNIRVAVRQTAMGWQNAHLCES